MVVVKYSLSFFLSFWLLAACGAPQGPRTYGPIEQPEVQSSPVPVSPPSPTKPTLPPPPTPPQATPQTPSLLEINPPRARIGQQVVLLGKHWATDADQILILLGDLTLRPLEVQKERLTFRLPDEASTAILRIATPLGRSNGILFEVLRRPRLHHVSPSPARPGDILTLSGEYFALSPQNNRVALGEQRLTVLSASASYLEVQLPPTAQKGLLSIQTDGGKSEPLPLSLLP